MLCFGEQIVGKLGLDLVEVVLERRESVVLGLIEEQVEFGAMKLETIDLAVLKFEAANDRVRRVQGRGDSTKPVVGAEWSVGLEPVLQRSSGNLNVGLPTHDALRVRQGMADIKYRDRVENGLERVCLVLIRAVCEAVQTFRAFVELEGSESISALLCGKVRGQ